MAHHKINKNYWKNLYVPKNYQIYVDASFLPESKFGAWCFIVVLNDILMDIRVSSRLFNCKNSTNVEKSGIEHAIKYAKKHLSKDKTIIYNDYVRDLQYSKYFNIITLHIPRKDKKIQYVNRLARRRAKNKNFKLIEKNDIFRNIENLYKRKIRHSSGMDRLS